MRAVRFSVFAVVVTAFACAAALADSTPPIVTPTVTGTLGNNGWYVSDVTLGWSVVDAESPVILTSNCGPVHLTTDTFSSSFTCSATSLGGTAAVTQTLRRDTQPPVIDDTGNDGTYSIGDTIIIFCNASDPLSGVASTNCAPITGAASSFPIDTPVTFHFTATDHAGNMSTVPISFTVQVTYAGVAAMVDSFTTKSSLDRSLQRLLFAAEAAALAGDTRTKERLLEQFADRVRRNADRNLSAADGELLLTLITYL
jgi:hypothetical protein